MLSAYLISDDKYRCQAMNNILLQSGKLLVLRSFETFPASPVLARMLTTADPDVAFVDMSIRQEAIVCAQRIRESAPNCIVFGFVPGDVQPDEELRGLFHDFLRFPVEPEDLLEVVDHALLHSRVRPEPNLFAFIPAKAGSGASTLAWNTAARMSRERKVLLMEADLTCGALSFLLNVTPQGSLQQLLNKPEEFSSFLLRHYMTQLGKVDALLSDRSAIVPPPEWETYFRLIDAMIKRYSYLILDMPERLDAAQRQLLRRAGKVFIVATPDIVAIRMAERTIAELRAAKVADEHMAILLNRCGDNDLRPSTVESFLGLPVAQEFPHDHWSLNPTVGTGQILQWETNLGRSVSKLAASLLGTPPPLEKPVKVPFTLRSLLGTR